MTYRVKLPTGVTAVRVAADFNYQTLAYGFLQDLLRDDQVPEVDRFRAMYEASDVRAERIASAAAQVDVPDGTAPINESPTASFAFSCTDLTCTFDGAGLSDGDGSISGYAWQFGDGSTAVGTRVSHGFAAAGNYDVTLTVTDDAGDTASTREAVAVSITSSSPGPRPGRGPRR